MKSIHRQILEQVQSGSRVVLATVIRTSGSTPQKPGSSALFGENGLIAGTVGGGLLEAEVEHIAMNVLISGVTDWYYFNLDSKQGDEGAICGGEAVVLVDANPGNHLKALEEMGRSLSNRIEGTMLTMVGQKNDHGRPVEYTWLTGETRPNLPAGLDPELKEKILDRVAVSSGSGFTEIDLGHERSDQPGIIFLEHIQPLPHLVIIGAGHIGKALAHLGSLLDFEISVLDDRSEYASRENIPDADNLMVDDIRRSIEALQIGADTYVVIVTRGHRQDAEALKLCIGSNAAYVGMIGSKHKVAVLRKQFLEEGLATSEQWSKIYTPIGIPIGSKTVQEIAFSIAAQLIAVRNKMKQANAE
jgi:xanthine dehydrogenase accessory factor